MTHREQDILHSIVESYIQTGEPVGSQTVSRLRKDNLSAATVRNVMSDLCDGGYLSQPHTSAGGIPPQKDFRSYVHSLAGARLLLGQLQRLPHEFMYINNLEAPVGRFSQMFKAMAPSVVVTA